LNPRGPICTECPRRGVNGFHCRAQIHVFAFGSNTLSGQEA
jgi:hypothetical protein